jgi:hypothetical protein
LSPKARNRLETSSAAFVAGWCALRGLLADPDVGAMLKHVDGEHFREVKSVMSIRDRDFRDCGEVLAQLLQCERKYVLVMRSWNRQSFSRTGSRRSDREAKSRLKYVAKLPADR